LLPTEKVSRRLFLIMSITVAPTYLLSVLWLKLPKALHILADISGILQLSVLIYFLLLVRTLKKKLPGNISTATKYLWMMASIAFALKIILQFLSIIPILSGYAFGFRPIVIGYLHLSFLGIISFFILGYINQLLSESQRVISRPAIFTFSGGVVLQEIILMMQGLEVINFQPLPYANMLLFCAAIIMEIGLIWVTLSVSATGKAKFHSSYLPPE
jgi:hypothetical protein